MNDSIPIRVVYLNSRRIVILDNDDTIASFTAKCIGIFNIENEADTVYRYMDSEKFPIPQENFSKILMHFGKLDGRYYVRLDPVGMRNDAVIITTDMVETYLTQNDAGDILKFRNDSNMPKTRRTALFRLVSQYLRTHYGNVPSREAKEAMERALSDIFPWMKSNENGTVNPLSNHINGGMIGIALKNSRRAEQSRNRVCTARTVVLETTSEEDEETARANMNFLKAVVVNDENMEEIRRQIVNTASYRAKLLRDAKTDIKESFPFFFADPNLVLFDFAQRFKCANVNGLIEKWPTQKDSLRTILDRQYKFQLQTMWPTYIEDFLVLLKLISATGRANLGQIVGFQKAVEGLICFEKIATAPRLMVRANRKYPLILACGEKLEDIVRYFIQVENHLFEVPMNFNIMQVMDLFFKIHMVLNVEFEPNIKKMMIFLGKFFYGMEENSFKVTNIMTFIHNQLINM